MLDFAITGLGRCRTAWFAAFLSDGDVHCHHEFAHNCESLADFDKARVQGKVSGVADTLIWLAGNVPAKRTLVVHRDPAAAERFSFETFGVRQDLAPLDERLWQVPGTHVFFDELNERMAEIVWLLTGKDMSQERFDLFRDLKIEVIDPVAVATRAVPEYWRKQLCLR